MTPDAFPLRLFMVNFLFYSGQSIYSAYLNLYLNTQGLGVSRIGFIISVSTVIIFASQLGWGVISDRAKSKNRVLLLLYAGSASTALLFQAGGGFWFFLCITSLFSVFFNPIPPLQDNMILESFEDSKWNYGQIRIGGTLGYALTVLLAGFLLHDNYRRIFPVIALLLGMCFVFSWGLQPIRGCRSSSRKTPYSKLFENKALMRLIAFNVSFFLGLSFFYAFYPIYFTAIGGNSSLIGAMMFACVLTEIPALLAMHKVVARFGIEKPLIVAGILTGIRWFLLFFLKNPRLIIAANLLHGVGYASFSYCTVTYINRTVPKDLRATCQSAYALICNVVTKIVIGFIGGMVSEAIGAQYMLLFIGCVMAASTGIFFVTSYTRRML